MSYLEIVTVPLSWRSGATCYCNGSLFLSCLSFQEIIPVFLRPESMSWCSKELTCILFAYIFLSAMPSVAYVYWCVYSQLYFILMVTLSKMIKKSLEVNILKAFKLHRFWWNSLSSSSWKHVYGVYLVTQL